MVDLGIYQQLLVVISSYYQLLVVISSCRQFLIIIGSYQQLLVVSSSCRQLMVVGGISYWYLLVVAGSYQQLPVITDWSRLFYIFIFIQLYFSSSHDVSLVDFVSGNIGTLGVLNSPPLGSANVVLNQCSHKAITLRRLYL